MYGAFHLAHYKHPDDRLALDTLRPYLDVGKVCSNYTIYDPPDVRYRISVM